MEELTDGSLSLFEVGGGTGGFEVFHRSVRPYYLLLYLLVKYYLYVCDPFRYKKIDPCDPFRYKFRRFV